MKKILLLVSMIWTIYCQGQKATLDSTEFRHDSAFDKYSNGRSVIEKLRAIGLLKKDVDGSFIIGSIQASSNNHLSNFVPGDNVLLVNSHNNVVSAKNAELYNTSGATVSGADHHLWDAPYADVGNDANNAAGESVFMRGSGNWSSTYAGITLGVSNYQGGFTPEEVIANKGLYTGGALIGLKLRSKGTGIIMLGYNFYSTVYGTHIGYGSDQLSVLPGNIIAINGVQYLFTGQPQIGSQLTCTAVNGSVHTVAWVTPTVLQTANRSIDQSQITQSFLVYDPSGRLIGKTGALILKPINQKQ
jgi:hypothetical protein